MARRTIKTILGLATILALSAMPVGAFAQPVDAIQLPLAEARWGDPPAMTERDTDTISNQSANCEGEGWDNERPSGPVVPWASRLLGDHDINLEEPRLTGRLDPADPGSAVAGSGTWQMRDPEGTTLTATWELAHDGPIVLPHD